jgi:Uri superfamily endonuclease
LGSLDFSAGYYAYTGSALNSLESRISRHLSDNKKIFWHVDYLLLISKVVGVWTIISDKRLECSSAARYASLTASVKGFGSSDCRCRSHLFFSQEQERLEDIAHSLEYKCVK